LLHSALRLAVNLKKDLVDKEIATDFEKYWFNGEAELSSFQLTQALW
jgi:hypothetical protein